MVAKILFTVPLPCPEDDDHRVRSFHGMTKLIKMQCNRKRVFFCDMGERLSPPAGVISHLFGANALSKAGVRLIT